MEIVFYQNGVGKYYPVIQLGDLTNAPSGFPGGISQASGGTSWAAKQGTWNDRPATPSPSSSITLDTMEGVYYPNPPSTAYSIDIYHDSYFPSDLWEFRIAARSGTSETVGFNNYGAQGTPSLVFFAVATLNMIQRFGFYAYNEAAGVWAFVYQPQNSDSLNQIWYEAETEASPGDKDFNPTGAYTDKNIPGIGGRGTEPGSRPRYKGDPVTQPGAPDESQASAVRSGFINCYMMTQAELDKVCDCLYSDTLLNALKQIETNPLDFIVSLMVFPTNPDVGASEAIKFGKWSCISAPSPKALGTDMSGAKLSSQFKVVDFGTLQIPENWGSFLDYESQIELYLPFVGTVSIDVSECMGGSINVQYTIDFFTGMCVANVLCSKPAFVLPNGDVIQNVEAQHAFQGNCAIQIPLSAINYGNMVGSLINACTQGITNPVAGLINAGETALSGGFRPSVTSKGNIVANSGFCSVLYPYIRITRPITAEPESFQEVLGYPSYINTTLGECEGLCVCEDIDIEGITGATENELSRIKSLCSEGVYI